MDLILVGAGLANSLIAARLMERRPQLRFLMLEAGDCIGGNHTWSFHDGDVTPAQHAFLKPFVSVAWRGHEVRFPAYRRDLSGGYASIASERLAEVLAERMFTRVRTGAPVVSLAADHVILDGGERINAHAVIDGRGVAPSPHLDLGFQKFLGQEVLLTRPHGLIRPILMDASVAQIDGYRFIYVLPLDAETLLIEDTYYADGPGLDMAALRARIARYAAAQGWEIDHVVREEEGVLPIALGGDLAAFLDDGPAGVARSGLRAALFHPTTGYSLPDAVRLADMVSALPDLSGPALTAAVKAHAMAAWEARGFFRLLNRMLFRAAEPTRRYGVLERFYRLSEDLVGRFYADRLTLADKARILTGRPPVPVLRALSCLAERRR